MNRLFTKVPVCKLAAAVLLTAIALIVTGCGLGTAAAPEATTSGLGGKAMGGVTPIVGATVKLYNTTSSTTSYGVGHFLQEATTVGTSGQDTDANGFFTFAGGYTCPAGQFAYITLAGGNTGANAVNASSVLVAALGRCEDIASHTFTVVNELSTIAAAYALGHFSAVTGTGAATVVGIGSSSTNNAVSGAACVANGTTCTTTVASGLAHAFLNAANLVNVTGGAAYATVPTDAQAAVPQALINHLGNILVSCVNSAGGLVSGSPAPLGVSDGTACGNVFAATSVGTTPPPNTFSAMVNLAANPTLSGSGTAVTNFFNISTSGTVYTPDLSASTGVSDYSIAIYYPAGLGVSATTAQLSTCTTAATTACPGLTFPTSGAVDINDVYYMTNSSTASGATINLFAFSSNGTLLSNTPVGTAGHGWGVSVDAIGHGYFGNGSTSGTTSLGVITTNNGFFSGTGYVLADGSNAAGTGNKTLKVYATAVDRANNVWEVGNSNTGASSLWMSPSAITTSSFTAMGTLAFGTPATLTPTGNANGILIDSNQNVWLSIGAGAGSTNTIGALPNNGTLLAPTYTATQLQAVGSGTVAGPLAMTSGAGGTPTVYNAFYTATSAVTGVQPYTPTYAGTCTTISAAGTCAISTLGQGAITTAGSVVAGTEYAAQGDGLGSVWLEDTNSSSVIQFNPNATAANDTAYKYQPCLITSGACSSVFTGQKPFYLSIDSTGSMWVPTGSGSALSATGLVQIIGAAAPTWPLLSLGLTGMP